MAIWPAGCGGGSKRSVDHTASHSGAVSTVTETATTTVSPSRTARLHLSTFQTPSGNIGCAIAGGTARCDIGNRDWSPPPKPASCQLDFGQGIELTHRGRARFVCAGDTARDPGSRRLPYGATTQADGFVCRSEPRGITCIDSSTRRGFSISKQAYRLF